MSEIMFQLVALHFVCDFPLQTEAIALGKNRCIDKSKFGVDWYYWMISHSITHGLAVFLVTGSLYLGLAETIFHFIIDDGKCNGVYGIHVDQLFHFFSKFLWAILFMLGVS